MVQMNRTRLLTVFLLLLQALPALADKVYLKSGRSIEGLIVKESDTQVVVDLGVGTTTLNRSQIERIEQSSGEDEARIMDDWRKKYYLHKKNVPEGLWPLVESYQKLVALRQDADKARGMLAVSEADDAKKKSELDALRRKFMDLSRQLVERNPQGNQAAYNALVAEVNAAGSAATLKQEELENSIKGRSTAGSTISSYLEAVQTFSARFAEEKKQYEIGKQSDDRTFLFKKLSESLAGMEKEIKDITIPTTSHRNGTVVMATINNLITARFIVDTGAATMTISESTAQRLRLNTQAMHTTEVILADGSKTKASAVRLASVQIGDARADNVDAVILGSKVADDVDGLLGMSFLRNFVIRLDPVNNKLILKKFDPK